VKKAIYTFVFALLLHGSAAAQMLGGTLILGLPQNEFKEQLNRIAYGVNVEATLAKPSYSTPITIGASVGYLIYGTEDVQVPFSRTVGRVFVNVNTTNSLLNFHLMMKLAPFPGPVRPYLEGLLGGNYLFTTSKVEDIDTDEEVVSSTNLDDFAWSYGYGGGILINLISEIEGGAEMYLDIKARYLYGTKAKYLKEGSIRENGNGDVIYDISETKTDLLTLHVGIVLAFGIM